MEMSATLRAFRHYLRTGDRLAEEMLRNAAEAIELKFNPYHDPQDGRFTFGPGGGSLAGTLDDDGRVKIAANDGYDAPASGLAMPAIPLSDGLYRPDEDGTTFRVVQYRPSGIGDNGGPPLSDPITLDAMFPRESGGSNAMIAVADNILDVTGPAAALTSEMTNEYSSRLIDEIKAVDPSYRFDTLGVPNTFDGQMNQINDLRLDRAAVFYKVKGNVEPLQVETALPSAAGRCGLR